MNSEIKHEPGFHIKPKPEILHHAFSDGKTDVKKVPKFLEKRLRGMSTRNKKVLEPQCIHIPKTNPEFDTYGDYIAVSQENIIANAFDLYQLSVSGIFVSDFYVNERNIVANYSDLVASGSS